MAKFKLGMEVPVVMTVDGVQWCGDKDGGLIGVITELPYKKSCGKVVDFFHNGWWPLSEFKVRKMGTKRHARTEGILDGSALDLAKSLGWFLELQTVVKK